MNELERAKRLLECRLEMRRVKARNGLLAFTKYTKPNYEINWHHRVTCYYLNKFIRGEIKNLMVFQPPRHGKSELVSRRLPAYILGRDPTTSIIAVSYSDTLASRMNRDVQRIIESTQYHDLFPRTRLKSKEDKESKVSRTDEFFEIVDFLGSYKSGGILGSLTGLGCKWLLIDDPIKNQEEADSPVYRDKTYETYDSTVSTRLEKDGSKLLTVTRWHEDDLAGRLLQIAKEDPKADQWVVLNLPAIKEPINDEMFYCAEDKRLDGEALWPNKYPAEEILKRKAGNSRTYNALYQQRPAALEGGIIKRSWLKFYQKSELPPEFEKIIQSWDLNFKEGNTSDYVVGQVWGVHRGRKYLLDQFRAQVGFSDTLKAIMMFSARYPNGLRKLIEEKANGAAVIETLKRNAVSGVIPIKPTESKHARLQSCSTQFEAGDVWYPDPSWCSWIKVNVDEITTFPNAAHDDTVDATSQALNDLAKTIDIVPRITVLGLQK